jgi:RNA polymerase sigma-70 factor, ECF subfamily
MDAKERLDPRHCSRAPHGATDLVSSGISDQSFARELQAARSGDDQSQGRLLESCREYLQAIAGRGIGLDLVAKTGASDLVQETLFGAHRDFFRFHGETREELLAWLRSILQNRLTYTARHYRNAEKRRVDRELRRDEQNPAGPWDVTFSNATTPGTCATRRESLEALQAALERIPEDYRQTVMWHQYDGLGFEEIGIRMGRSKESARKLWSRALASLAAELGPNHAP